MAGKTLFQMDCSAIVYPYFATDTIHHSFTMEVDLDRDIDPDLLRQVARDFPKRFPTLFVKLYKDAFGYKLEHVDDVTKFIMPRPELLNMPYDLENNENLIRITYRRNRLAVECFHSVTDGSGAITLLKTLTAAYYRALGEEIPCTCGVLSPDEPAKASETEDSFRTNFKKCKGVGRFGKGTFLFKPDGPFETWHQTEVSMDVAQLKPIAKANGATLTEYMAAVYLYAFLQTDEGSRTKKPIVLEVPINLRPVFDSETLRNFSLYFYASVPKGEHVTFDEILENVKREFKEGTDKELLQRMVSTNVAQQDTAAFRMLPRAGKRIALRIGAAFCGERLFTTALSNLGIFKIPDELAAHVRAFHAVLGPIPRNHILTTAYCYNGRLGMMFSSRLAGREIENNVKTFFEHRGVETTMIDNNY